MINRGGPLLASDGNFFGEPKLATKKVSMSETRPVPVTVSPDTNQQSHTESQFKIIKKRGKTAKINL